MNTTITPQDVAVFDVSLQRNTEPKRITKYSITTADTLHQAALIVMTQIAQPIRDIEIFDDAIYFKAQGCTYEVAVPAWRRQ